MSEHAVTCYDYVNQPYARVRDALIANPLAVFRRATSAPGTDTAALHVQLGGLDIGRAIAIEITGVEHSAAPDRPQSRIALAWQAASNPGMFPSMKATLLIFPLTPTETQLELRGTYVPPMGKLGDAIDASAGHRYVIESVTKFIQQVAGCLRDELATAPPIFDAPISVAVDSEC